MPFMNQTHLWLQWARRGAKFSNNWAPLPPLPVFKQIVPTAQAHPIIWHYTINKPPVGWNKPGFNDSGWKTGPAGFGSMDPGVTPRTSWLTDNIWLRRHFIMPAGHYPHLVVYCYHDQGIQLYINGVLATTVRGYSTSYVPLPITPAGKKAIHPGKNLMAVHVHQTVGGQFFDAGLSQWYVPKK